MDKTNPTGTGYIALNNSSTSSPGNYSVSLGYNNQAKGNSNVSLGLENSTSGSYSSVAIGYKNTADRTYTSITIGRNCLASGSDSTQCPIAIGDTCKSYGPASIAMGYHTKAEYQASFVCGQYNKETAFFVIGNGTYDNLSDAMVVKRSGDAWFAGDITSELSNVSLASIETGSWTPVVDGVTTTTTIGSYMKVGNMVTINFYITGVTKNNVTNSTGFINITGIPFEASTDVLWYAGGGHWQGGYIDQDSYPNGNFSGYVLQPSNNMILPRISSSATTGTIAAGSGYYIVNNSQTNTVHASGTIMYKIA